MPRRIWYTGVLAIDDENAPQLFSAHIRRCRSDYFNDGQGYASMFLKLPNEGRDYWRFI